FIYFISGIVGNVIQYFLMPHSSIPTLGASGAIAGILGAYFILYPRAKVKTLVLVVFLPLFVNLAAPVMLGYWFILQLVSGAASLPFISSNAGGIAFFAHIGGFVAGMLFALIFKAFEPKRAL
ncbi:MAG: rhomboid family intramembrane serine protease, partial [Actinobacteria bacterium]|nr:rhomboid family intramembrane serine protease [Actinomycetota bacterium]